MVDLSGRAARPLAGVARGPLDGLGPAPPYADFSRISDPSMASMLFVRRQFANPGAAYDADWFVPPSAPPPSGPPAGVSRPVSAISLDTAARLGQIPNDKQPNFAEANDWQPQSFLDLVLQYDLAQKAQGSDRRIASMLAPETVPHLLPAPPGSPEAKLYEVQRNALMAAAVSLPIPGMMGSGAGLGEEPIGTAAEEEDTGSAAGLGEGATNSAAEQIAPSSRALGRALETAGRVRQTGDDAHHVVAGRARAAAPARAILARWGIDLNDPANGVFLPGARHAGVHTAEYYEAINKALAGAGTKAEAEQILQSIGQRLQSGTFP